MSEQNRYSLIIEDIFFKHFKKGECEITFTRSEIEGTAQKLKIKLPLNLGDIIYSFRYRTPLPEKIINTAPKSLEWIIRPAGRAKYKFVLTRQTFITPAENLAETKILNATPGLIIRYALGDEQGLLARVRYNRLIDIFTGLTCYSLQNHLRTTVPGMGQVETDELYIAVDKRGAHYVIPVQAKGGNDKLSIVQILQDYALCESKFPDLICKCIAAQFKKNGAIVLFEFEKADDQIKIVSEKHYRLVDVSDLSKEELEKYNNRLN